MDAIQNAETLSSPEHATTTTTVETCPACMSGTDPLINGLGVEILQDLD